MNTPIPELTILNVVSFTAEAWNLVKPSTIASKTGIISPYHSSYDINSLLDIHVPSDNNDDNDEDIIQRLIKRFDPGSILTAN